MQTMFRNESNYNSNTYVYKGTVKYRIFEAKDSNYRVLSVKTIDKKTITVTGNIGDISSGVLYAFTGNWEKSKYGLQFRCLDASVAYDDIKSKEQIIAYLSSRLFEGIGEVMARKIYDKFGSDSVHIIETEPEKLIEIKGITKKKVEKIKESFKKNMQYRELTILLRKEGVTDNMIDRIYEKYATNSMYVVKEEPYRIAYDVDGFGFKRADKIALAIDEKKYTSSQRLQAGIYYALSQICSATGSLYVKFTQLADESKKLLDTNYSLGYITDKMIDECISDLCRDKKIILRDGGFYPAKLYYNERESTKALVRLLKARPFHEFTREQVKQEINLVETEIGITYETEQVKAIINSLVNNVSVITGGPGTGKSTIINCILKIYKRLTKVHNNEIGQCAFAGVAVNRITEVTGMEAKTIHRTLMIDGRTHKFKYNRENKLPYKLLIVDEMSMVDLNIFTSLITAVKEGCKVIFIGDVDQLPSIGPGNVLKDMITSEKIPTVMLKTIFRQSKNSNIINNAHIINNNNGTIKAGDDFQMIPVSDDLGEKEVFDIIVKTYEKCMEDYNDVIVLCPCRTRARVVSSESLNDELSKSANPDNQDKVIFKKGDTVFHNKDKIIHIKNNYDKDVFNGERGYIDRYYKDEEGTTAYVKFDDKNVTYDSPLELELSYAMSIHKSQGTESQCVIIPIIKQNIFLLNRNLIYTAVTRAKAKVVIICHKQAFVLGCQKTNQNCRLTNMENDIRIFYNTGDLKDYAEFSEKELNDVINGKMGEVY